MAKKVKSLLTTELIRKPLFWLLVVSLLGGAFRFYNLDWDLKHSFHPDERNILGQTSGIQPGTGYRVNFFAYGQLPVYLYRATGELVSSPQALVDFFRGNAAYAQSAYWLLLALLFGSVLWFFSREKHKLPVFGASALMFLLALFIKFSPNHFTRFDIFNSWFGALEGLRFNLGFSSDFPILPLVCFAVVAVAAFGISGLGSHFLEIEWVGLPFYGACGVVLLLGVLPGFLPDQFHFPKAIASLAFTVLVVAGGLWFAWASRWGRVLLGVLALWTYFATRLHGGNQYTGYGECMIIGRWWAALFSTLTIWFIYLFIQRAYKNTGMALLAAAFFAFAVVSIEQTHYCITESLITFMCVVVAYCSAGIFQDKGSWKSYLLAGAAFGISMASKTSSLFYIAILLVGHLALLSQKTPKAWESDDKREKSKRGLYSALAACLLAVLLGGFGMVGLKLRGVVQDLVSMNLPLANKIGWAFFLFFGLLGFGFSLWGVIEFKVLRAQMPQWIKLAAALGLSFFLFCLLSPWSLLDYQGFMTSQNYEWHVVSIADACYVLQFKDTPRYLYHLWNLMSVELWWPLGVTVVLGMVWVLGRFLLNLASPVRSGYLMPMPFVRGKGFKFSLADLILLGWFVAYFGFIGSWNTKFIRYMVPLIPAFCIFGARFLTDFFIWLKQRFVFEPYLRKAVIGVVVGFSLFYSMAYMHVYRVPHTWIESSVWIFKNVPLNSMILKEAWDDGLPTGVDHQMDSRVEGTMGPQNYREHDITIYEMHGFPTDNTPIKKNYYANLLPTGDYISIASKKLWYTITDSSPEFRPNGFNAYPVTSRYYRCLWSGLFGYKMVAEFHSFPKLFGWEHPDDMAEESFSVYDHPRVYFFKKVENVSSERILKLLESDDYVKGIDREKMRMITPDNVDAFIAERHKYLEDHGLLKQLEEAAPVTAAALPVPSAKPPPSKPGFKPPKSLAAASVSAPVQPTPEIVINAPSTVPGLPDAKTLQVLKNYSEHPVVEDNLSNIPLAPEEKVPYQLRAWFTWLGLLIALGLLTLPLTLRVFAPMPSGAYSLSKILGFFLFAWVVWFLTSIHFCRFTAGSCWTLLLLLAFLSVYAYKRDWKNIKALYSQWGRSWLIQEGAFTLAFFLFTLVRIYNPNIHDPVGEGYNGGGEAGMDFGFLASVVRSESFPPQNMWMAGLPIGYTFYYGHLMMGILTKTLGLVPAVTYNLGLITLFATIFSGAFGLAYSLSGRLVSGWIGGFLCAVAGNVDGAKQYLEALHQCFTSMSLAPLANHTYDFWGPTRVIPPLSINEFPYFSVLFGDLHAHTLAMPFAMLLIGVLASFYMSAGSQVFHWAKDWLVLLTAGFLLGGIAFLNTWEVPTWLVLAGIVLLVRHLSPLNGKVLTQGLALSFGGLVTALLLLSWWLARKPAANPHAVGGTTALLVGFGVLGLVAAAGWMYFQKKTGIVSRQFLVIGISLAVVLGAAGFLWSPFFVNFHPQQSTVLWVLPTIRTSLRNYFNVYGSFLAVVLLSFLVPYSKGILGWIGKEGGAKGKKEPFLDKFLGALEGLASPRGAVQGMMTLGLVSLAVIWGASWVHWTEPTEKMVYSRLFATAALALLILTQFLKNRLESWVAFITVSLVWLGLLVVQGIHLVRDMSPSLDLGLFSILFLLGFFHLGLAVKVYQNRGLSFAYIVVSFFFFLTAALEIFAMSEYFGFGEGMRNNSLFKYGINAWTLASVGAGVFTPRILEFLVDWFGAVKKETPSSRRVLMGLSGLVIFILLEVVLESFLPSFHNTFVYILDFVVIGAVVAWVIAEGWIRNGIVKAILLDLALLLMVFPLLPLLPTKVVVVLSALGVSGILFAGFVKNWFKNPIAKVTALVATRILVGGMLYYLFSTGINGLIGLIFDLAILVMAWRIVGKKIKKLIPAVVALILFLVAVNLVAYFFLAPILASALPFLLKFAEDFSAETLFLLVLTAMALIGGYLAMEKRKDMGRRMVSVSWGSLFAVLALMISLYPYAASIRKCHGFLNYYRQQWGGFVANPTLNGLSYIRRVNQPDDAAIRFLNEHVPGQPCLMEFVGAGYNTWGSRFSIFTGIPALMGWDGHVGEWVGARLGDDIRNRVNAVQEIFQMTDAAAAKKMLDAYGVRLVMVGTVERHGAAEKPGYSAEGLAKFQGFLPLIYKNPQVEIYYNPPSVN